MADQEHTPIEAAEEWRPVVNWEGIYEVSSHGRVRSMVTHSGRARPHPLFLMTRPQTKMKYPGLVLNRGSRSQTVTVHILVAAAFLGPRPNKLVVAHLDGNPQNNLSSNLAYVTPKENQGHREAHGTLLKGSRNPYAVITEDQVRTIRRLYVRGSREFGSTGLGALLGINVNTVKAVLEGRNWGWLDSDTAAPPAPPHSASAV